MSGPKNSGKSPKRANQPPAEPKVAVPVELSEQWSRVRARLRAELGDATFNSWLKNAEIIARNRAAICLAVPTDFMARWIESHYLTRLLDHWRREDTGISRVDIEVNPDWQSAQDVAPRVQYVSQTRAAPPPRGDAPPALPAGDDIGAPLDPRFTFGNFVVGKSNEMAHAVARRLTESENMDYNPLVLYGGVGLGKTHLMQAIAWEIRRKDPHRTVLYLSAEKFMYEFIRAIRYKDTMAFKQQFRTVDVLMIDDIQFIAGKESTQEEFFHTFNALIANNRQIIISADSSPSDIRGIDERIRTRLVGGMVVDVHPTDYELRLGILQAKADLLATRDETRLPREVLEFLAQRIVTNIRELEGALNRVVAYASFVEKAITLEMTRDVLRDLLRATERRITIDEIQRRVADYYNIKLNDMLSPRRARVVARPRQIAMYLSKQLTARSLPEIGNKFGKRDHTTVIHAVKRVEQLRGEDAALDEDVDLLLRMLEN